MRKSESMNLSKFQVQQEINNQRVGVKIISLAVNKDHNLLVECSNDPKLLEYTTYGVLVRQVNLNISNPIRVAQLHTGLYGIIHLDAQKYQFMYSVMDTNGQVAKRSHLAGLVGFPPQPIQCGHTVSRNGTIFTVTRDSKILILHESGDAFKEEFLPRSAYGGALNQPYCVHFDDSKKQLYICEARGVRVLCCSAERK